MTFFYTRPALDDLRGIVHYISEDDTAAARRTADRIQDMIKQLEAMPQIGRPGRIDGTRELVVAGSPYLVIYRLDGSDVQILRILHGAQLWPPKQ